MALSLLVYVYNIYNNINMTSHRGKIDNLNKLAATKSVQNVPDRPERCILADGKHRTKKIISVNNK